MIERKVKLSRLLGGLTIMVLAFAQPLITHAKDIPGATQTSYAVSPSGAFSFQVPIIVPQGVNGVQPNLSLNFSSARGNGRVGVGWDVTGLSAINRCGQTLATHGRRIGVKYEGTDRYCLDGQPLILVSGSYGVAGSEYRTEIDSFARITVTGSSANNLDGTHAATEFKVERKDGSIWTYGAGSSAIKLPGTNTIHCWKVSSVSDRNNNSYNVDYRSSDGQPASISYGGVASIDLNYENRNDVRERYFGGHKFTYNQRVASIDVKRGTSIVRQYNLGYRYSNGSQSQLTSITECGMNNECMPPIQVTWHDDAKGYTYSPAQYRPKEAMIEYTSNGGQTNRGVFADVNNDGYVDQVISYRNTAGSHVRRTYLGSKTGLSATPSAAWNMPIELVEYTTGIVAHSQINSTSVAKAQLVDVNSDGLPDVVFGFEHPLYIASTNTRTFKKERGVYLNNGNGWNSTLSTTFIPPEYFNSYVDNLEIKTSSSGSTFSSYILTPRGRFIDINNDGRVDWVTSYFRWTGSNGGAGGVSHKAVYLNNGSAWVHNAAYSSTLPDVLTRYVREHSLPTGQMVDINGDGLVDWVQSYHHNRDGGTTNRGVWLNTGTQFQAAGNRHQALPTIAYENYGNTHNPRQHGTFIDLNGDGLTDYLADSASGSWVPGYPQGRIAYLNTGRGWVRASSYDPAGKFQHKTNRAGGLVLLRGQYMDLNNDGLVDFSGAYRDANNVNHQSSWINTGTGWAQDNSFNVDWVYFDHRGNNDNSSTSDNIKQVNGSFADMNADGSPDWVISRADKTLQTRLSNVGRASLLNNVTTTLGVRIAPKFAPLTRGDELYIQYPELANGSIAPTEPNSFYINGASYVTESVTTPTPVSGTDSVVSYQYQGAQANRIRGFLGFKVFTATSSITGLSTITALDQTFPYIGRSVSTATTQGDSMISVSATTYDNDDTTHADGTSTYFVYTKTSESQQYELSDNTLYRQTEIEPLERTDFDNYGNLKTQTTRVLDGWGRTVHIAKVTNEYEAARESDWLVARLKSRTNWNRSAGSKITGEKPAISNLTTYTYDLAKPWLLKTVNREPTAANNIRLTTTYEYDDYGNVESEQTTAADDPQTPVDQIEYDANHRLPIRLINALGKASTIAYHAQCDQPSAVTDPNGQTVTSSYDNFCRQLSTTSPDNIQTTNTYSVVNESCPENDCQRDVRFKVTSEVTNSISSLAIEPAVTQHFGALNQVLLTTTGGMNDEPIRQQTHYDAQGRVISATQPYFAGQEKHFTNTFYDVLGRQIKVQLPYYTNANVRAEQTYSYGVSATGRLERQVTDAKSRTTKAEVNALGQVTRVTDAENGVMQYNYDSQGNLIETIDAMGNSITLTYDLLGRRTQLNDPDLGTSTYTYNGFSELTSQTDAKNKTISMEYDLLGRLVTRSVPGAVELGGGVSTWEYDTAPRGAGGTWFGAISRVEGLKNTATGTPGYVRSFEYDALGRASSEATTIDDQIFNERYEYSPATGRLATRYYPNSTTRTAANLNDDHSATEFGVKYEYTNGYLSSILSTENAQGQCIEHWRANHYDALGRVDLETMGRLVTTKRNFRPGQNVLEQIRSVRAGADPEVQDLQYTYDAVNNLTGRTDALNNITETFDYDNLDRLINHVRTKDTESPVTTTVQYNAIGNITFKSDVGHYSYNPSGPGSVRPHAVKGITGSVGDQDLNVANTDLAKFNINWEYNGQDVVRSLPSVRQALLETPGQADPIQYDVNGNATQSGNRSIAWTPFDKPQRMAAALDIDGTSKVSVYQYGPEQQRIIKREATVNALSVPLSAPNTTVYIGKYYERIQDENNNVIHRYMIETGGTTIQIERAEGGSTDTPKYLLADNLGSTHVILNGNAEIEQTLAFDPWGMRLNVGDSSQVNSVTNRGYTGHEMDDEVGLINMNARVYDPYLGRFMSADPVLPDAFDMQSFNRYAYVLNNPLKYVDPTGNMPSSPCDPGINPNCNGIPDAPNTNGGGFSVCGGVSAGGIFAGGCTGPASSGGIGTPIGAGTVDDFIKFLFNERAIGFIDDVGAGRFFLFAPEVFNNGPADGDADETPNEVLGSLAETIEISRGIGQGLIVVGADTVVDSTRVFIPGLGGALEGFLNSRGIQTRIVLGQPRSSGEEFGQDLSPAAGLILTGGRGIAGAARSAVSSIGKRFGGFFRAKASKEVGGSIRNVNRVGGTRNCANCAIATDATLAGNPASALNSGLTKVTDVEKFFGRKFGSLTSASRIQGHFQNLGNGARGVVFGSRGGQPGHFFNVVNQNGTVRFLDGQTGKAADLTDGFRGFSFLRTN